MALLISPVVSLRHVHGDTARLVVIAGFTVLFAGSVAVMTSARRAEVFAATAAYAAVLVVFVNGELGSARVDNGSGGGGGWSGRSGR